MFELQMLTLKCYTLGMYILCVLILTTLNAPIVWGLTLPHTSNTCSHQHTDAVLSSAPNPSHMSEGKLDGEMAARRLAGLRTVMAGGNFSGGKPLAAYIVPTADAHQSEYIASSDALREWLSGFTGSAGTAVVTQGAALVWTDGRYYTQFLQETDSSLWTLMRQSLADTPSQESWLSSNLAKGSLVGVDPKLLAHTSWTPLETALTKAGLTLLPVYQNLVVETRNEMGDPAPTRPCNPIVPLPVKYTGKAAGEKISDLCVQMKSKKAAAFVVTSLDEVAYMLNIRGSDIPYNPVLFAYLVVRCEGPSSLFTSAQVSEDVRQQLRAEGLPDQDLAVRPYEEFHEYLEQMAVEISAEGDTARSIWLSQDSSQSVHISAAGGLNSSVSVNIISEVSPVSLMKVVKNEVELQGMRECHIRDGTALIRFFSWLHQELDAGCSVSEVQAGDKLLDFRREEAEFVGESFSTIAGAGEHGAIIHYRASPDLPPRYITKNDMFLLDSGGQYRDGTTDVTRTRHMGSAPTDAQKAAFTRVLKGQIALGTAIFPRAIKGNILDTLARKALWDVGLDYAHGTGHGVGHHLNVHEGPSGISWRTMPNDPGLQPGMVFSNEPGYYEEEQYGIRHEDLIEVISVQQGQPSSHPRAAGLLGDFAGVGALAFHTMTLAPHHLACVDAAMMTSFEIDYLNAYHARVLDTVGSILKERGLDRDYDWLVDETVPLRSA